MVGDEMFKTGLFNHEPFWKDTPMSTTIALPSARHQQKPFKPGLLDSLYTDIAIDLGTANTLIYTRRSGIAVNEPSIVAMNTEGVPVAVGNEALMIHEKSHSGIRTIRPLRSGVIADFKVADHMIQAMVRNVKRRWYSRTRTMIICVPSNITGVERRAVRESAKSAGARDVFLVDEPIAAAIGIGLNIHEPKGHMIVDIGGGTTEIAVICLSGIVHAQSVRLGGDVIIEQIVDYLRRHYNLLIGYRTAERIKIEIGSVAFKNNSVSMVAKGRDIISGMPASRVIQAEDIQKAISESVNTIIDSISKSLDQTPPEFSGDLLEEGIHLAGGGALLKDLDRLILDRTGVPAHIADDPLTAVVRGTGKILDHPEEYRAVLH